MEDLLNGESVNKRPILRLRCNLDDLNLSESNWQSEFEVESFKRNKDESRYLDLNNQIFKGHPDQSDWDLSKLLAKMGEVWFRPDRLIFMKKDGSRNDALIDRLLFATMIEARSCERFRVLSLNMSDPDLREFYHEFMVSEAGHYVTFIDLAKEYKGEAYVKKRWQEILDGESEIIKNMTPSGERIH